MSTNFEAAPRATAAGVTTAAILVLMLAMGASTAFETSAPSPSAVASHDAAVKIVRSSAGAPVHKS
jgi:hypothetical protein